MRIKNFTLMLLAVLFSTVGFAQRSSLQKDLASVRKAGIPALVKQTSFRPAFVANPKNAPASSAAKAPAKAPELVTPPASGYLEYFTLTGTIYANQSTSSVSRTVKLVWDDEDEDVVYISGLSYYMPDAFVKGTFTEGDTVVFAAGQYMGSMSSYDFYFGALPQDQSSSMIEDVVAVYDEADGSFTFLSYVLDNGEPDEIAYYAAWLPGLKIAPADDDTDIPVQVPEGLVTEPYAYTAYDYFAKAEVSGTLNIGIYEDNVYIQGIYKNAPNAWIKGKFTDETTVSFTSGQLLKSGTYFNAMNSSTYEPVSTYVLLYDAEKQTFSEGSSWSYISDTKNDYPNGLSQFIQGYEIKKISEKAAVPAKSAISSIAFDPEGATLELNLASVDVNGEGLVTDKVAFILYTLDESNNPVVLTLSKDDYGLEEDLTEIPASLFANKLPLLMSDYTSISQFGIQTVYYGGEERNEAEISWYTPTWPVKTTLPAGLEVTTHNFEGVSEDNDGDTPIEKTVKIAFDGNDMYIGGLGEVNEDVWVKGTKNAEGNYVFAKGQEMGIYASRYRLFLVGYENNKASDVVLTVNTEAGVYEFPDVFLENAMYTDKSYFFTRFAAGATISMAEAVEEEPELVAVPEGLETEAWSFSGTDSDDKTDALSVNIGFDGDDVYVQGLCKELPEAWVKGTRYDDVVTFAPGQFLGVYRDRYEFWFIGLNTNNYSIQDYVLTLNEDGTMMSNSSTTERMAINIYKNKISASLVNHYGNVTIKKVVEKAAIPVAPTIDNICFSYYGDIVEFTIPLSDVEGDGLIQDSVSYKFYYDDGSAEPQEVVFSTEDYKCIEQDMTVVPYGFVDVTEEYPNGYDFMPNGIYLNMNYDTWKRIGLQTIYTGGGETNASEITWYTIVRPQVIELPDGAEVAQYGFIGKYLNYDNAGNTVYTNFTKQVYVAKVDNDVYIKGVGRYDNSNAWIKGTAKNNGVYTFTNGQFMGIYPSRTEPSNCYLVGYNNTLGVTDVRMSYDAETGIFTTSTDLLENADYINKSYFVTRIVAGAQIIPGDNADAITSVNADAEAAEALYNVAGQRVSADYKGIVVKAGKKTIQK